MFNKEKMNKLVRAIQSELDCSEWLAIVLVNRMLEPFTDADIVSYGTMAAEEMGPLVKKFNDYLRS